MTTRLRRADSLPPDRATITLDQLQWRIVGHMDTPLATGEFLARIGLSAFAVSEELHRLMGVGLVETVDDDASLSPVEFDDA